MIIDAHTDVLWKMLQDPSINFYQDDDRLAVNYPNMIKGGVNVQIFAIFVSSLKTSRFEYALQSVDDFYQRVEMTDKLQLATNYEQIISLLKQKKKVAILSIEGAEVIEGDLSKLRTFYRLGVRAMGLTWNQANEVADGVMEPRNGGLTQFGYEVVHEMNQLGMMIDLSHLSEHGFWDVMEISRSPIMASHANAKRIYPHPRNLNDEQIKAIIRSGGMIGVTFVSEFTAKKNEPDIDDLLRHIEHIAALGGINHIGLGSDFDGAEPVKGLENASKIESLVEVLSQKYSSEQVQKILGGNWLSYFKKIL